MNFKLKSSFKPTGDQPEAIKKLTQGVRAKNPGQVLLGVTGSGKTFSIANVIKNVQKPTLVISHNKTLAIQLYQEFKEFFPDNAVAYFVSYYDYYQPESYLPQTDTYIAKEAQINEEIDKLRLAATSDIFSRKDVIVIASVSCIYNIGSPEQYQKRVMGFKVGQSIKRSDFMYKLVALYYQRLRMELKRGYFRVRGESIEICPAYTDNIIRVHWENGKINKISQHSWFGRKQVKLKQYWLYPAKHYLADPDVLESSFKQIKTDLKIRLDELAKSGKNLEANRLEQKVNYDLEMIKELGYVNGIENYSRYFDGRMPGDPPYSLLDYFIHEYKQDFLVVIDESHMTIPQIRGMFRGDESRKKTLIDFGFRLPSALDNRPLRFEEVLPKLPQTIFVSATPNEWEIKQSKGRVIQQLIRPTGLVDPEVEVRDSEGQIQDLIKEIKLRKKSKERVLVTTLTKRMAEELSRYLEEKTNIKVHWLHADIKTLERTDILTDLRLGKYDCIVGVNLLREGLDLPEVSLVAIIDADKQGFLRSRTSLVQTMGRAARNVASKVILYADETSKAMKEAMVEVERRRVVQLEYNQKHGIESKSIIKPIRERIVEKKQEEEFLDESSLTPKDAKKEIIRLKKAMREYVKILDFEQAARVRDKIAKLKKRFNL